MRAVVVAWVVALSATAQAQLVREIPPPATLVARPLAKGQWVEYRESVHGEPAGTIVFGVLQREACGTWFEASLESQGHMSTWHFCVGDDHTITEATHDDKVADAHAPELAPLLSRVLPPAFTSAFVREDVFVPAGNFHGAQRRDGASTTWLHPAVPLGAVVKVRQGDREDVLVAYGDMPPPISVRARSKGCCRHPMYGELALGVGHLTGVASGETGRTFVLGYSFGTVLNSTTDIVFSALAGDSSQYSDTLNAASTLLTMTGGVRISPMRLHTGAEAGLYVQTQAGYASLRKGENDIVGNGVALVPAIGWQSAHGRDWSIAIQASDQLALLNRNVGFRQGLDLTVTIQLWTP